MINFIAQALGLVGTACSLLCYQQKSEKKLLILYMSVNLMFALQMFMLGAITGGTLSFISFVRTWVFANKDKKWASSPMWLWFFIVIMIIGGILTWKNIWCIFSIVGTVLGTVAVYMTSSKGIRAVSLVASPCHLIYALISGAYTAALNEVLAMASIIIGILRHDRKSKEADTKEM